MDIIAQRAKYPHGYYSVQTDRPEALAAAALRRAEYEMWQTLLPDDLCVDFEELVVELTQLTGKGERTVHNALFAHYRMRELPNLRQLQEETYLLDTPRILAIDDALGGTCNDDVIAEIDRRIALYLVPKKANQTLPTARQLARKIYDYIKVLDAAPVEEEDDGPSSTMGVYHGTNGRSVVEFDTPTEVAIEVEQLVRTRQKQKDLSAGDALLDLIHEKTDTKVVLNLYRAYDVEDAPGYVFGMGWLTPQTTDKLAEKASVVRNIDDAANKEFDAYQTPEILRTYVAGRDGSCRFPGHDFRADLTQMDHVVNFDDGGPTCAGNLECLCQRHHNVKTDGRTVPILLANGDIVWLFENGTWAFSEPSGPLSTKARRWVQTLGQRIDAKRAG